MPDDPNSARLEQLAQVSAELSAATTIEDVIEATVDHGADAIGAAVSTLVLAEGTRLRMVAGRGLVVGRAEQWAEFGLDDDTPASEVMRTGRPVVMGSPAEIERNYPVLRAQVPVGRSLVCLPLGGSAGAIAFTFDTGWQPGPTEMSFLTVFAETCGQAVRRIQASNEAAKRDWELAFLAQVSLELASSLDYESTLRQIANLSVPTLADWCAVDIGTESGLATLAVAHVDPEKAEWARELQERYPVNHDAPTGAGNVFRTGVSEFYPEITDEMLVASARDEEHLRLSRELHLRSAMVVPIMGQSQSRGTLTLVRSESAPAFVRSDLSLAEEVGRRAGVAIDNAMLYAQSQDVALQLQRAVLPEAVDDLRCWEVAAHYAPGGRGGVGGDFYDAVVLADGSLAFAVGDVMGHGLRAAAAMAQIRSATRAYLSIDHDPAAVMSRLDVMFDQLAITSLVTLFYAVADVTTGTLRFSNAGHYPGLVIAPGAEPRLLSTPTRLPLGAGGDERVTHTVPFGANDVLMSFTDGLVERRGEIIDEGVGRLVELAPTLLAGRLADCVEQLVARLTAGHETEDDVTVLAVRRRGVG
ncbi:MAG TPA: SpoIIE family protein phosphatase [Jatrophihabitans sp.]